MKFNELDPGFCRGDEYFSVSIEFQDCLRSHLGRFLADYVDARNYGFAAGIEELDMFAGIALRHFDISSLTVG